MNLLAGMAQWIDRISERTAKFASWLTLALVLLTTQQVIARYLTADSSIGMQELEWHLFAAILLLGAADCYRRNAHVRVDIIHASASQRTRAWIEVLGIVFFLLPACGLTIYYGIEYAAQSLNYTNQRPLDYYSGAYFDKGSFFYVIALEVETLLRKTILLGEVSPNPGGLEARWLVKGLIPLGFLLLALQSLAALGRALLVLAGKTEAR